MAPIITHIDREEIFRDIPSPDYFAYRPVYGRLNEEQSQMMSNLMDIIDECLEQASEEHYLTNLKWLRAKQPSSVRSESGVP